MSESGVTGEIDLLSLDMDGVDYWVWKALDCIQPRVVVCETQNVIPPNLALTVPYNSQFREDTGDFRGASLAAMTRLAEKKASGLSGFIGMGSMRFLSGTISRRISCLPLQWNRASTIHIRGRPGVIDGQRSRIVDGSKSIEVERPATFLRV
jgi:hypothetical protein